MPETTDLSKPQTDEAQLVVFTLSGCEAAVSIRHVREIIRVGDITWMPKAPAFLEGILNLRGRIIPVLDLKKRFQMPLTERTDESRILVLEAKDQIMGFGVDKVVEVLKIPQGEIQRTAEPLLGVPPEFIEGLVALDRRLVLLFDLKKLLTLDDSKTMTERTAQLEGTLGH